MLEPRTSSWPAKVAKILSMCVCVCNCRGLTWLEEVNVQGRNHGLSEAFMCIHLFIERIATISTQSCTSSTWRRTPSTVSLKTFVHVWRLRARTRYYQNFLKWNLSIGTDERGASNPARSRNYPYKSKTSFC